MPRRKRSKKIDESDSDDSDSDDEYSDLIKIGGDILTDINYKVLAILFLICIIIMSDVFIMHVLSKSKDAVSGTNTTTKGTFLQIASICLGYVVSDFMVKNKII